jgi:hypothetical protein
MYNFGQVLSTSSCEAFNDRYDFQFYQDLESDDVWGKSGPLYQDDTHIWNEEIITSSFRNRTCDSRGSGAVPDGSKFFNFF